MFLLWILVIRFLWTRFIFEFWNVGIQAHFSGKDSLTIVDSFSLSLQFILLIQYFLFASTWVFQYLYKIGLTMACDMVGKMPLCW